MDSALFTSVLLFILSLLVAFFGGVTVSILGRSGKYVLFTMAATSLAGSSIVVKLSPILEGHPAGPLLILLWVFTWLLLFGIGGLVTESRHLWVT